MKKTTGWKVMSAYRAALLVILTFVAFTSHAQQRPDVEQTADGLNRIELESGFTFTWKIDGDEIEATISAPTTGWVSVGFNPTNRMQGATYVIGYVQGENVSIRHDWGHTPTGHQAVTAAGGTSRVTSLGGREQAGRTELSFKLPLDPGDRFFSALKAGEENTVIWAFGPNGSNNYTAYHAQRGAFVTGF
ncbi:MAG: hypothetical protein EA426_12600 [Spirochaetaceae bacterium]|nr:MAG: hypothetical protein EA426_12600 [Spirochaetaceae bacterium]